MPGDLLGWILIGLLAGSISGWFVRGTRSVQGCLPTIVVGVLGAVLGGWLVRESGGQIGGFLSALAFAVLGSIIVRIVLRALEEGRRR